MNTPTEPADRPAFSAVMDEFLDRLRRGERPDVEEYAARHPDLAPEIRDVFPTLHLLEAFGSVAGATGPPAAPGSVPPQLGEFLILREVGRGGMGVVYEAVQQTLGRHVALKVFSPGLAARPAYFERFRREAQAAARLHHTNIVPVFAVGEEAGVHFYAMQFIRGQSLAAVLDELRRPPPAGGDTPPSSGLVSPQSASSSQRAAYYRNVAAMVSQAADALHHAHTQGVVHRDVKPGNLLMDARGEVWVSDFGLAKVADADDLTATGDVLGTLAYMAPEQLAGHADARTDVYALGLTLYELVTLRPAFRDEVRVRLVEKIRTAEPPPPRALDPLLPRDLETVLLKATAKEPGRRYATAGEFADDLRRFLSGRPVVARRVSWAGHARRWCRRNPWVAGLSAAVFVLLLSVAVVSAVSAARLGAANETISGQLGELRGANDTIRGQIATVSAAERETARANAGLREALRESYLAQAREMQLRPGAGRRLGALELVRKAAAIRPTPDMRDVVIAASASYDLEVVARWPGPPEPGDARAVDFTPALSHFAHRDGTAVVVRRATDGGEVARVPVAAGTPTGLRFGPDGRLLAVRLANPPGFEVWDWAAGRALFRGDLNVPDQAFDLSPDGTRAAVGVSPNAVRFVELDTGRVSGAFQLAMKGVNSAPHTVRYSPDGTRLLVSRVATGADSRAEAVAVLGVDPVTHLAAQKAGPDAAGAAWRADGERLALAGTGVSILAVPPKPLTGFAITRDHPRWRQTEVVEFGPGEGVLVTSDGSTLTTTVWDTMGKGEPLVEAGGRAIRTDAATGRVGFAAGGEVGVWRLHGDDGARRVFPTNESALGKGSVSGLGHPDLVAAVTSQKELEVWDARRSRKVGGLALGCAVRSLTFDRAAGVLYTDCDRGLFRWPVAPGADAG